MRVLLADDQAKVRSALKLLLEHESGVCVVGECADADALLAQMELTQPDVVLLDWELPGHEERDLLARLRALSPHVRVIALSGRLEANHEALAAGVDAFVSKSDPPERLLESLQLRHAPGY